MEFFVAAFGLLLHILIWGAGAAILLTPRAWRSCWPVFCAPMGLALQSAVVWAGAYSNLAGAQAYARWAEAIPVLLLALAWWRAGGNRVVSGLRRFWALGVMMILVLCVLVLPMALASRPLTTSSLGSCDAADYAAGARVLQEFARGDRGGFMGLTEVVQVASVDNFFDFWLRLNHFTPSALIAFNGAVFGWQPYQITGLMTALLLVVSLPAVFWLARAVMRYSPSVSLWIAAIYGFNPITWYAVAHVAMGQLLAAHAIVFLTWVGVALWRGRLTGMRGWEMAGVLAMAYWLVLGSYNFIVLVCLVPVLAYAGGSVLITGEWRRFGRWLAVMLAPLIACGAIFTQRTLGLVERFQLFGQYDFGWHIPAMSPEGWLGAANGPALGSVAMWLRLPLSLLLLVLLAIAMARDLRRGRQTVYVALALTVPILIGYSYLELRGSLLGTNASYDAYKLLAVFLPGQLAGYCYWATLAGSPQTARRWATRIALGAITACNLAVAYRFAQLMQNPPLMVDPPMAQLQRIESLPEVTSINMKIEDFWTRLWANSFLLQKEQYFQTHTYEGRRNTDLKGEWDLSDGLITLSSPSRTDTRRIGHTFNLLRRDSPYFLSAELGEGWHARESLRRAQRQWHWSKGDATLRIENPQTTPRTVTLRLWARSLRRREVVVWLDGERSGGFKLAKDLGEVTVPDIVLPPGKSIVKFRCREAPTPGTAQDARVLGFAVYGIQLEVHPLKGADGD